MTDRELLELAAKAAGVKVEFTNDRPVPFIDGDVTFSAWNPLEDDGDAFRLMVDIKVTAMQHGVIVYGQTDSLVSYWAAVQAKKLWMSDSDITRHAAVRRAIVCAAAEIGRTMK